MSWSWDVIREWLLSSGVRIALIIVAALVVRLVVRVITRRIESYVEDEDAVTVSEREKRARTLTRIVNYAVTVAVVVIGVMMILRELGIDIGPILAGAGIAGLAIGFGAQSLVKDVISGFFILLENHFGVGDVIKAGGVAGLVESMSLRATVLRDLSGNVHVIPNGSIDVLTNMTKEWSRYTMEVGVAYKENVDRVMQVLEEVGKELAEDPEYGRFILEPLSILGVDDFANSAVIIKIVQKTVRLQQWKIGRELRRRIKNRFDAEGIEIPFPHVTLYAGTGEQGRLKVDAATS